ncbi:hypothetical protein [Campylobacter concisus]|uniref:hypothetical protein n=1 Tax=Campylobacter concisus TaxID=199 RepID=UPI000CD9C644|nr:hypothetical protein [Campylobacter concisus]
MKKILFAVSVVSMFCWANEIVVDCDEGYEEKICNGDYSCVASKCIYKNTDLLGAYKHYLKQYFQDDTKEIYKSASKEMKMPNLNKTIRLEYKFKSRPEDSENTCYFNLTRAGKNYLKLEYNDCSNESLFNVDFKKVNNGIEVILDGDSGA